MVDTLTAGREPAGTDDVCSQGQLQIFLVGPARQLPWDPTVTGPARTWRRCGRRASWPAAGSRPPGPGPWRRGRAPRRSYATSCAGRSESLHARRRVDRRRSALADGPATSAIRRAVLRRADPRARRSVAPTRRSAPVRPERTGRWRPRRTDSGCGPGAYGRAGSRGWPWTRAGSLRWRALPTPLQADASAGDWPRC